MKYYRLRYKILRRERYSSSSFCTITLIAFRTSCSERENCGFCCDISCDIDEETLKNYIVTRTFLTKLEIKDWTLVDAFIATFFLINVSTAAISFLIDSGICSSTTFPELVASTVETVKSLIASLTCSSVAYDTINS